MSSGSSKRNNKNNDRKKGEGEKKHHRRSSGSGDVERRNLVYASIGASCCATTYLYFGTVLDLRALVHVAVFLVLFARNAYSFFLIGQDKYLAMTQKFRISERELIESCEWCGFVGGIVGMMVFAHKVRKVSFLRQVVERAATSCVLVMTALVVRSWIWSEKVN
jgi:uncharacterized membrane protein YsdA (DUF1294 family)